ncbi:MAG: hypothetical protein ACYCWW_11885 [Deltaproteobacteria bacterium]
MSLFFSLATAAVTAATAAAPAAAPLVGTAPSRPAAAAQPASKSERGPVPPPPPNLFERALSEHEAGASDDAARDFYWFLRSNPETATNYGWAEHFLGVDLASLGFSQAAVDYLVQVSKERPTPEILGPSLNALEKLVRDGPVDRDLVFGELLYGTDFGVVPASARDFVEFHRGLLDYESGRPRWGARHFARLDPKGRYASRAQLAQAIEQLGRGVASDEVVDRFLALARDPKAPKDVRNDAKLDLARLHYERKEYEKAIAAYDSVDLPELDPGRGEIYLERAWALHRLAHDDEAFGYLTALEAPSFKGLFLPDKYLVRSLIYDARCHFLAAKRAAREFQRRYRPALTVIRERSSLEDDPKLLAAASQQRAVKDAQALLDRVRSEKDRIDRYASRFSKPGLTAHLRELYQLAEDEALRRRRLALDAALQGAADAILRADENLRLQDYQVGLEMYRRVKAGQGAPPKLVSPTIVASEVVEPFHGEFWNDELRSYRLFLSDRCPQEEGDL